MVRELLILWSLLYFLVRWSPPPLSRCFFFNEGNEKIYCALNCFVSLALSWVLNVASPPFFALLPLTAAAVKFLQHLHNYESESLNKLLRGGCTICCDMFGVARLFAMSLHTEAANTQLDILDCSKLISQAPDILKGAKCFGCVTEMTNMSFVYMLWDSCGDILRHTWRNTFTNTLLDW